MSTERDELPTGVNSRWGLGAALTILATLTLMMPGAAAARAPTPEEAIVAQGEIPEELLLDVGIEVFDPGVPEGGAPLQTGALSEVRKSEARYLPVRLMQTLQATGQWGAVRVVPAGATTLDVSISGRLVESSGAVLVLDLHAEDSRGREWLDHRYKEDADPAAYRQPEVPREPFQALYNEIANDLLAARRKLKEKELREVRAITELRFAADLVPTAFRDYLGHDRRGRWTLERLPAEDDPMMERVARVRERDNLFIDTLSEYYAGFQARMDKPYGEWRSFAYEEELARRKLQKSARKRKVLGALSILAGLLSDRDSRVEGAAADAAVIGGIMAVQSGVAKGQEAKIHIEALRELASSLDAEVQPILVDVEGQTLRLAGSMETQYATWRGVLQEIFEAETGFPLDPDRAVPAGSTDPTPADLAPANGAQAEGAPR